jgi:hypothetical protein
MFGQFYAGMHWSALPLFALALFLTTFLIVLVRTTFFAKRDEVDRLANLPLEDGGAAAGGRERR